MTVGSTSKGSAAMTVRPELDDPVNALDSAKSMAMPVRSNSTAMLVRSYSTNSTATPMRATSMAKPVPSDLTGSTAMPMRTKTTAKSVRSKARDSTAKPVRHRWPGRCTQTRWTRRPCRCDPTRRHACVLQLAGHDGHAGVLEPAYSSAQPGCSNPTTRSVCSNSLATTVMPVRSNPHTRRPSRGARTRRPGL